MSGSPNFKTVDMLDGGTDSEAYCWSRRTDNPAGRLGLRDGALELESGRRFDALNPRGVSAWRKSSFAKEFTDESLDVITEYAIRVRSTSMSECFRIVALYFGLLRTRLLPD
jgi:hypothetical protein